jgi:hypothetical protein
MFIPDGRGRKFLWNHGIYGPALRSHSAQAYTILAFTTFPPTKLTTTTLYRSVHKYKRFSGISSLHLQGGWVLSCMWSAPNQHAIISQQGIITAVTTGVRYVNAAYRLFFKVMGRDTVVVIPARFGLDSPGIESSGGGEDFPHPSRPAPGPTHLLYNGYRVSFPGGKAAGARCWPPTPRLQPRFKKE